MRDIDRFKYSNELDRELFLQALGYRVLSFSYDDVAERPEQCLMLLRMILGQYETAQVIPQLKKSEKLENCIDSL